MDNSIMVPGVLMVNTNDRTTVSSPHWTAAASHLLDWKHLRRTELIGVPRASQQWKSSKCDTSRSMESKRDLRKSGPPSTSNFECQICHWMCRSRIGLLAYNKCHSWWWDLWRRRLSPWCMYVCQMITFERLNIESSYLHIRSIYREDRSSSYIKVSHRSKTGRRCIYPQCKTAFNNNPIRSQQVEYPIANILITPLL